MLMHYVMSRFKSSHIVTILIRVLLVRIMRS
jgi:hypothetical protein